MDEIVERVLIVRPFTLENFWVDTKDNCLEMISKLAYVI